jgi:hypothetical protein
MEQNRRAGFSKWLASALLYPMLGKCAKWEPFLEIGFE